MSHDHDEPVDDLSTADVTQLLALLAAARLEADQLRTALAHARRIGAAMGIVMMTFKVSEQGAFDIVRQVSQNANRKLRDVADDIVLTGALPSASTARSQPTRSTRLRQDPGDGIAVDGRVGGVEQG